MTIVTETDVDAPPTPAPVAATPGTSDESAASKARNYSLDGLRATMTLLVLFHHTALTYGAPGGWFYREIKPDIDSLTGGLLTLFVATNQAYFMGLFFLLAGYFTPAALRAKGPLRFLGERLLRLGVPLVVFGVLLGPVTVALAATSKGLAFTTTLLGLWSHGVFIPGPLWFAEALLIFAVASVIWRALTRRVPVVEGEAKFPSNTVLWATALGTGLAAFAIRLWWPVGQNVAGLQLGYFASYVVLFVAGCAAARRQWLTNIPDARVRRWRTIMWAALVIGPALAVLGHWVPALAARNDGGWTWPAAIYAVWEPLVAWGMIMTLLVAFQRREAWFAAPGWRQLGARAYTIYIIHPPVLVALALAARSIAAPALIKFAMIGIATCVVSFALAGLILRIPGAKRIL